MTWWELSARIGDLLAGLRVILEGGDDSVEVAQDLLVHLDQPGLAAGLGGGDELDDLPAVGAVLGQELGGGEERRAGQTGRSASLTPEGRPARPSATGADCCTRVAA